ncbi:SOS response-associated peptidase [Acuticoccus sediminis]|uniref:SOS response-associated peptidase n=1 Tax=Acuticoccus sediminis TaxID=2184697 RepID=UPI001CFF02E4|nr:SOS response-associated peptidase [Acuticoccus sediminis]
MCGRYNLTLPVEAVRQLFAVVNEVEPFPPRYNIAPTQPVHVVRHGPHGRELVLMKWGFMPSWVKDPAKFPLLINARSETAAEKPAFRNAMRRRRVLLPATGYYEWKREGNRKVPFVFEAGHPIALAGIYETWHGPNGEEVDTVAVLTGEALGVAADYHDRMPLTVPPAEFAEWLDPANDDAAKALVWTDRDDYTAHPVSTLLSNARNEGAGLMTPDPEGPPEPPAARRRQTEPPPAEAEPEEVQPRLL